MQEMTADERHWRHAPRWEALIAALAIGSAYAVLPDNIRLGPRWLLAALIVLFAIPLNGARYLGNYRLVRIIGMALSALVTAALAASAVLLIVRLPSGKTPATHLLRDGALIWVINVLVFAIWYWELDCGGPHARHIKRYTSTDFLFPQFTTPDAAETNWSPRFLDYLFLSAVACVCWSAWPDEARIARWGCNSLARRIRSRPEPSGSRTSQIMTAKGVRSRSSNPVATDAAVWTSYPSMQR